MYGGYSEEGATYTRENLSLIKDTLGPKLKEILDPKLEDLYKDLNYTELVHGYWQLNSLGICLGSYVASKITPLSHELAHAAANSLTGGVNEKIVIDSYCGGDIIHSLLPEIQSEDLAGIGGQTHILSFGPWPSEELVNIAPYLITTPVGIYLLYRGKEKKSLPLAIIGSGLVANNLMQLPDDFYDIGADLLQKTVENLQDIVSTGHVLDNDSAFFIAGAFLAGLCALGYTNRLSKATVKKIRKMRNAEEKQE